MRATAHRGWRVSGFLWSAIVGLLLFAGCAGHAAAARLQLPPITVPASHEQHIGKVVLLELATPDLATAERFYGTLLGWTFRRIDAGSTTYAEALLDNHPVAGLFQRTLRASTRRKPAWLAFFATGDVGATVKTTLANGGKLLFGPRSFPDRGREAVLKDPEGAVFAVLDATSGDPPDVATEPGEWIWNSLITSDPDGAAGFYQKLFGYDVYPLARASGEHLILASGGFARASINSLPTSRPHAQPHWLAFVRVADTSATAAKVDALGGRVLVTPRLDHNGAWVALVSDPSGAVFGLLQWAPGAGGEPVK